MKERMPLIVVCLALSICGSWPMASCAAALPAGDAIQTGEVSVPPPTWLVTQPEGSCSLTCTGSTPAHPKRVLTVTTFNICCAYPGTLCPAGSPPVTGSWQPFSGSLRLCGFN
ncbi:MAG TPA: hypothetical protein VF173_22035 [Thermoanaerobaculia bacterium]|nr:hypothetical protein [Thermoanaerobaculia bacterium]